MRVNKAQTKQVGTISFLSYLCAGGSSDLPLARSFFILLARDIGMSDVAALPCRSYTGDSKLSSNGIFL